MRWLATFIALAAFFVLFTVNPVYNQTKLFERVDNGCLIYSLHHKMLLEANELLEPYLWSRILAIRFWDNTGHAVNVFVYKNVTFIYDPNRGSFIAAKFPLYDPRLLAEIAYPDILIKGAAFVEPTITLTYP